MRLDGRAHTHTSLGGAARPGRGVFVPGAKEGRKGDGKVQTFLGVRLLSSHVRTRNARRKRGERGRLEAMSSSQVGGIFLGLQQPSGQRMWEKKKCAEV